MKGERNSSCPWLPQELCETWRKRFSLALQEFRVHTRAKDEPSGNSNPFTQVQESLLTLGSCTVCGEPGWGRTEAWGLFREDSMEVKKQGKKGGEDVLGQTGMPLGWALPPAQ